MQTETRHVQSVDPQTQPDAVRLARVLGPTLMALTGSEALNYQIFGTQSPTVVYLNGLFLFAAGVSILQKQHRWTRHWSVLVTIIGWIATLGGFTRLFWPEAQQPSESAGMYVFLTAGFGVGGFLVYRGYQRRGTG
jgi:positive regulator of sigma E activity